MGQIKAQNSIWVLQTLGSIYALKTQNKIIATVLLVSFDGLQRYQEKRQTDFFILPSYNFYNETTTIQVDNNYLNLTQPVPLLFLIPLYKYRSVTTSQLPNLSALVHQEFSSS